MIDKKIFANDIKYLEKKYQNKFTDIELLKKIQLLYVNVKKKKLQIDELKNLRNTKSKLIKTFIKTNKLQADKCKQEVKTIKQELNFLETDYLKMQEELKNISSFLPNIPDKSVKYGLEDQDFFIKKWGKINKNLSKSHIELAKAKGIIDWDKTSQLSGSKFVSFVGNGAKLKRALINFMLDNNNDKNFKEISTPVLVKPKTVYGTGNLPKFKDDLYYVNQQDLYLIPTSEVTLTNFYQNTIFNIRELPIYLTQASLCFRQEAGAAGKDTKGIIRVHQFDKVETVILCEPKNSYLELELMVQNVESMLQKLELPYRLISLSTGSLGFAAAKTYDLEIWMPSQNKYREVSSCSNCTDFQARRINLKYKDSNDKNQYLHTLNGSAITLDRLIAGFIENHQLPNGDIQIPKFLQKYMNKLTKI